METHCLIFLTIGNLVSPPSFPFAGQVKGRTGPSNERSARSRLLGKAGPSSPGGLLSRSCHLRDKVFTHRRALIRRVTNGLSRARFCWSPDRFVAQLFFGSNPVLHSFSVFVP